jgi:hypothetical protein
MSQCKACRHAREHKPAGGKPPAGTVWCVKKGLQMGRNRKMPCFDAMGGKASLVCQKCKWAKHVLPHGGTPEPGNVWCDRRHKEYQRLRRMDCFEPR